ncbi:hypothetical protein KIPB_014131, partial [Kipferlia bialata]
ALAPELVSRVGVSLLETPELVSRAERDFFGTMGHLVCGGRALEAIVACHGDAEQGVPKLETLAVGGQKETLLKFIK